MRGRRRQRPAGSRADDESMPIIYSDTRGGRKGSRAGSFLPHTRDLREVVGEGLDAARCLAPVVVLVGGVVAVLGEAEADADDRRLEVLLHGDDGADRAALADERGGGAEAEADGLTGGVGVGAGERAEVGLEAGLRDHLDILVDLLDGGLEEVEALFAVL